MSSSTISSWNDFEITTSLRSDSILDGRSNAASLKSDGHDVFYFYMLDLHRDRICAAIDAFKWPEYTGTKASMLNERLQNYLEGVCSDGEYRSPLKLRVTLSFNGIMSITSTEIPAVTLECLRPKSLSSLVENTKPTFRIFIASVTTDTSLFTTHKTTKRDHYDSVRSMLPANHLNSRFEPLVAEILLVNRRGEIMEGSITTPYFNRSGSWITPSASCGGNLGTSRRYALEQDLSEEGIVKKDSVAVSERVVLSNGVRGFGWGFVEAFA